MVAILQVLITLCPLCPVCPIFSDEHSSTIPSSPSILDPLFNISCISNILSNVFLPVYKLYFSQGLPSVGPWWRHLGLVRCWPDAGLYASSTALSYFSLGTFWYFLVVHDTFGTFCLCWWKCTYKQIYKFVYYPIKNVYLCSISRFVSKYCPGHIFWDILTTKSVLSLISLMLSNTQLFWNYDIVSNYCATTHLVSFQNFPQTQILLFKL